MTTKYFLFILVLILFQTRLDASDFIRNQSFDNGWKFFKGKDDRAEKPDFDDSSWRVLNLPHDWSIEDLPNQGIFQLPGGKARIISGPFDSEALAGYNSGYTVGGTGWYRKHFTLPEEVEGKVISILFDGVYMNADVWINGHHLGNHPYGYTAFEFELSGFLNFGDKENVIAVEVKNEGINSRWYSGSGIYRHVYLEVTDKIHVARWGTFVSTESDDSLTATIDVKTTVNNYTPENTDIDMICSIFNGQSLKVAEKRLHTQLYRNLSSTLNLKFNIERPQLWSPGSPSLYKAVCTLIKNGKIIDETTATFGIRTFRFDSEKGFILNGKRLKLKGGSMHANNGPLGAVANDRAEERRVELMKAAGFNAVRCAHNPPSSVFLNACDRLGLLVIDEAFDVWRKGWREQDYHLYFDDWWKKDVAGMIMRDRNHPGIFTWSICNQVRENRDSTGIALAHQLVEFIHTLDPSRPVSANVAQTGSNWRNCPPEEWKKCDPYMAALDICGYSYQASQYKTDHERLPDRIMFSSEIDPRHSFENWMSAMDNDFVLGNFEWTAMDFMGEVALGWWGFSKGDHDFFPWTSTYSGDIDLCGFKRPRSYYRDVLFNQGNKLSAFVFAPVPSFDGKGDSPWGWDDVKASWTWPGHEGELLTVVAYSACDSVSLFLNGKLIGTKVTSRETEFKAPWNLAYVPGILKAVGYINGTISAEWILQTAGKASTIHLSADRETIKSDGKDLCYVTVKITDKNGILDPHSDDLVHFTIKGEGKIVGVGNSNPQSVESFQQPCRKAYEGKCLVIIQSSGNPGQITLEASGKKLKPDKIMINAGIE